MYPLENDDTTGTDRSAARKQGRSVMNFSARSSLYKFDGDGRCRLLDPHI